MLVRKLIFPRGHSRPPNAVFYFPKGFAFRIVLNAIAGQLRRAGIFALGYGRRGRVSFCCAVANHTVCFVELDAVDEIVVSRLHRIRIFRSILIERRLQRYPRNKPQPWPTMP